MTTKLLRRLLAVSALAAVLLCACAPSGHGEEDGDGRLTWGTWGSYSRHQPFLELAAAVYPDIELEFISYAGGNATGYSWAQMRADDIPDIFITSQVLDEDLARERLADLSGYDFINDFSTAILDQVSVDGGIYLLPSGNSIYGIYYNQTLMEEHGWAVPSNFAELEELCGEIRQAGLIPGVVGTQLTGGPFSTVFNLAKTSWLTTPEGGQWQDSFLAGNATAAGRWEDTMDYVQRYIDAGMLTTDPDDRSNPELILDYLGNRKAVFCTVVQTVSITELPETGDRLGMMPYIGEDGSKNVYMYSPTFYFGLSKRLTEPGNEKKLEDAIRLLSLLFSPEGQATFISDQTPCVMSVLSTGAVPEDSMIYDAQQALWQGRAFQMTYTHWENVLADMGQAYKEWFRGENGMDGAKCIQRMDRLQRDYLDNSEDSYFCESAVDFTLEETAKLVGKAMGTCTGVDAVMVPLGDFHDGKELRAGVSGKLYAGKINADVTTSISPAYDGEYAVMEMTGAQAKAVEQAGFDADGDGNPYQYLLVAKGDRAPEDNGTYRVAFLRNGYTEETAAAYGAEVMKGSLREFLRTYLEEQKMVSPHENHWE
jgi:raffinose/stachyose/melibiose transport system substrate-binding protein